MNRRVLKRKLKNSNPQSRSLPSQSGRTIPHPGGKISSKTRAYWHWATCGIQKTTQNSEVRQQERKSSLKYLCLRICRTFNLRTGKQIRSERTRTNLNLTPGLRNTMSKLSDDSSTHPRQVTEWLTEIHKATEVADLRGQIFIRGPRNSRLIAKGFHEDELADKLKRKRKAPDVTRETDCVPDLPTCETIFRTSCCQTTISRRSTRLGWRHCWLWRNNRILNWKVSTMGNWICRLS